jgi:hypothetical protein
MVLEESSQVEDNSTMISRVIEKYKTCTKEKKISALRKCVEDIFLMPNPDMELWAVAIEVSPMLFKFVFEYIEKPSDEIVMSAVCGYYKNLDLLNVGQQTHLLCLKACQADPRAFAYVKDQKLSKLLQTELNLTYVVLNKHWHRVVSNIIDVRKPYVDVTFQTN